MFRKLTMMTWVPWAWDPITGCTPVSEGCANCIARWQFIKSGCLRWDRGEFQPTLHPQEFRAPTEERSGKSVFVVPQGDLFHESFPLKISSMLLDVMREAPQHTYYILTKRQDRMHQCLSGYRHWPLKNVNLGISAENQKRLRQRIPALLDLPIHQTAHRYVSCEPLLGPVVIGPRISKLGAVICGVERGCRGKREGKEEWIESLRVECQMAGVPFFHHGSGVVEREKRPQTDREMRELQAVKRMREYQNGGRSPLPEMRKILEMENISWEELTRRIGSEVYTQRGNIFKGLINPCSYRKIWEFIDNYIPSKGEAHAASA